MQRLQAKRKPGPMVTSRWHRLAWTQQEIVSARLWLVRHQPEAIASACAGAGNLCRRHLPLYAVT